MKCTQLNLIQQEHNVAEKDVDNYLKSPINTFRLIRRLFTDWPSYEKFIAIDVAVHKNYLKNLGAVKEILSFPTEDDIIGSIIAIERLQETYQLNVSEMAAGVLNAVKYSSSMTWKDCYLVGEYLFAMEKYDNAIPWLRESSKILMSLYVDDASPAALSNLEILADYLWKVGEGKSALQLINYVLQHDVRRQSALQTKLILERIIKEEVVYENLTKPQDWLNEDEYKLQKLYERVCRGELKTVNVQQQSQLFCKYLYKHPYRLLQPFKLEELSLDPYLIIVYDVINDNQMKAMREIAQPHIKRSRVLSCAGETLFNSHRTSKTAWFNYTEHIFTIKWLRHVNHLTGLNTKNAEHLQVVNYGLGGHYVSHLDFFVNDAIRKNNRIATAMYYLSDVEEGGGTAFPYLNILVKPRKGAMLFWYNLHLSGDGDHRTRHGGCPVLVGSKWIATIWLSDFEQFDRRPCNLTRDHEISLRYKL